MVSVVLSYANARTAGIMMIKWIDKKEGRKIRLLCVAVSVTSVLKNTANALQVEENVGEVASAWTAKMRNKIERYLC